MRSCGNRSAGAFAMNRRPKSASSLEQKYSCHVREIGSVGVLLAKNACRTGCFALP